MNKEYCKPFAALVLCSAVAVAMLAGRVILLGSGRHLYLAWNLILAWLPLIFALGTEWWQRRQPGSRAIPLGLGLAWLMFLPNAPYILTDIVHLRPNVIPHFWPDLVLLLVFGLTGLVLGFVSLFVMQRLVVSRFGWATGWCFVSLVTLLNGFGIYAGRFFRWNSWDVVFHPLDLCSDLFEWAAGILASPREFFLPVLFGSLMFLAYAMLYSLTHLQSQNGRPGPGSIRKARSPDSSNEVADAFHGSLDAVE
jgi:uncharacterized membrane protein